MLQNVLKSTASPRSRSNMPKTPARCSPFASRPAPSPTRSNCGAEHDRSSRDASQAGRGHQGRFDGEAEGDDEPPLRAALRRAGDGREGRRDLRARQSQRTADVLRLRQQSARGQRHPERPAQDQRQFRHGGREARPLRGRLHLREVRHRHDGQGQYRPERPQAAGPGRAAAVLHRLLHLHEVVRAAAPAIQLRNDHVPHALSWRTARSPRTWSSTW